METANWSCPACSRPASAWVCERVDCRRATPSPASVDVPKGCTSPNCDGYPPLCRCGEARKLERDAIIERCAEVADAASALGKMAGGTGIQGAVIATRIRALKAPQ